MSKLMMMFFLTFSVACVHLEPQYRYTTSFKFNTCKRFLYDLKKRKVISKVVNLPLSDCDDVTGFKTSDIIDPILPWVNYNIKKCKDK